MASDIPVNQELWIVAKKKDGNDPKLSQTGAFLNVSEFCVPDGEKSLSFGSFDNLIRLTDELQKCDSQLDSIVHRLERQLIELDPKATFIVKSQRQEKSVGEYLKSWTWDDSKYPRSRSVAETVTFLMGMATKDDDAVRNKAAQFNEAKTLKSNLTEKVGANLLGKDLVDVLTPDVVKVGGANADFVVTEHLATVVVILGRGADVEFLKTYESFCDNIVPCSAKKFEGLDDKDGNMIYRVVMFKAAVEPFKKACREKRFLPRDFEYSADGYKKLVAQREAADEQAKKLFGVMRSLYAASWSDAFCAWMHVKAMRIYVESVLRFGMPPAFKSFIVTPKPGGQPAARKALEAAMGGDKAALADGGDDGEEFFPYVSCSLTPFTASRA